MEHNENTPDHKHLKDFQDQEIEGKNILGGGVEVEPPQMPPTKDELGYDNTAIPLENPIGAFNPLAEGPPLNVSIGQDDPVVAVQGPGFTNS